MGRKVQIRKLPFDEWDALIAAWNDLPRDEKQDKRQVCLDEGHAWALAPIGFLMCQRCCDYIHPEDQ